MGQTADILGTAAYTWFCLIFYFLFFLQLKKKNVKVFFGGLDSRESTCNAGDPGFIPGLGRSPGEANGNSLQYSCLEKSMNRGIDWRATIY